MDLIGLLITIVVVCLLGGLALYVIQSLVPDPQIVKVARVAIVVIVCLVIIWALWGVAEHHTTIRIGSLVLGRLAA